MHVACPDLPAHLASGATVITPNRLLASVASEQHLQSQLQTGVLSWRPPVVLSVGAWLSACWQLARYSDVPVPTLLSPSQERAVWQELIESEHPELFDYNGAVGLAISATRVLAEWHIPRGDESWSVASDTRHFQQLLRRFRQRSEAEGWIVRSDLWTLLPDWIAQPWWDRTPLAFAAFANYPPALAALLNRLGPQAHSLPVRLAPRRKPVPLYECADPSGELELAVRWARHAFEDSGLRNSPPSLAILLPNLQAHKPQLERLLQQIFYPGHGLQPADPGSIYHLHVHQPASQHPLIAAAQLCLELASPRVAIADAGAILRSPYLAGAATERNERALADFQLRRYRDLDVSLSDIERASRQCPLLTALWSKLRPILPPAPQQLDLPGWSELITKLLSALGWPGDRDLTPGEQAAVEHWNGALTDLAALGFVSGRVPLRSALAKLRSLLDSRTVQTSGLSSPLQVLDAGSVFGLQFDSAAIAALADDAWPPTVRPSPFVPLRLQRGLVTSTMADRSRLTEALFSSAPALFATTSGHLAPAARPFVKRRKNDLPIWTGLTPAQAPPSFAAAEELDDSQAPPFHLNTSAVPGGVSILKAQSQCPFQAFAKYRLNARSPEDACFGFDARERGSFLHRALENVWRELKTRDRLRSTSPEDRRSLIHQAVEEAVGQQNGSPFHQLTGTAERERLEEVIAEWLLIEEGRERAFTVEHIEQERSLRVSGLPLNLRIDRVDRLSDGSAVLIDYKSGEPKIKSLEGERPAEPQLLVYATAMEVPVEGIFFAQLKPRNLKAVGWSRHAQFPVKGRARKNTRADWDSFLSDSRNAVQSIASEFLSGWAAVDPQPDACTFCNLKGLCRINELNTAAEDTDDSD